VQKHKRKGIVMRLGILSILLLFAAAINASDIVYFEDGSSVEIPDGYKVIIVPDWVKPKYLKQEVEVNVLEPGFEDDQGDCTPANSLSLGAPLGKDR